jgi:hypothetical protein
MRKIIGRLLGSLIGTLLASMTVVGCLSLGYSSTDTLGIRGHELAAREHELSAANHRRNAGKFAPCANSATGCPTGSISPVMAIEYEQAVTDQHLADQHRARIEDLRDAEHQACSGLLDRDGHVMSFGHVEEVRRIEKAGSSVVSVMLTATNDGGLKLDEVERVVQCHLARNASRGLDAMDAGSCPFVPGARATVRADGRNLSVTIVAPNDVVAKALDRCSSVNFVSAPPGASTVTGETGAHARRW